MKKYTLFILAGFLFFAGSNELQARAVKLGRSTGSGTSSSYQFQPANNGGSGKTTFCPANCAQCNGNTCTRCKSGYLLSNGQCTTCPTGFTCSGDGSTTCSRTCSAGYYRDSNDCSCVKCTAGTYNASS
ncbi:MAG: hypothetical protein IJ846_02575, partial [Alphaproteobacteria bacterium]|nr:hypothetical protein [Alphaproteobacteria bacterium]